MRNILIGYRGDGSDHNSGEWPDGGGNGFGTGDVGGGGWGSDGDGDGCGLSGGGGGRSVDGLGHNGTGYGEHCCTIIDGNWSGQ